MKEENISGKSANLSRLRRDKSISIYDRSCLKFIPGQEVENDTVYHYKYLPSSI